MIREAIFSDETASYVRPPEPETGEKIRIRIRTAKDDVDQVFFLSGEESLCMQKAASDRYFDYYETERVAGEEPLRYHFQIKGSEEILYFDRVGSCETLRKELGFEIIPGFKTPDWAKGALMYQIFVDRFRRGDETNDVLDDEYIYIGMPSRHISDWWEYPSAFDVGYFYGGDLQGVWDKLDYLRGLGVEVIYFNPLFVSPSNHKYDAQDYEHIDPHYGKIVKDGGRLLSYDANDNRQATKYMIRTTDRENLEASDAFFASFASEVHKRGMKIIIDGVFNHCGSFHKWMDRERIYKRSGRYPAGAYQDSQSPYADYFRFNDAEDRGSYDGWWGHETLPKLYYENSRSLYREIMKIAEKWISPPYSVDGWRLDVAADLGQSPEYNHAFWRKFRDRVKSVNPEVFILAEHYGDPSAWLDGKQWDSIMNYDAFMEPVSWFLTGMEKHSDWSDMSRKGDAAAFFDMLLHAKARMPMPSYMTAMNELSNHDHSRFLTRTNGVVGRLHNKGSRAAEEGVLLSVFRQAVIMQMTLQGAPTIYYGDEVGLCGWTDPDNRRSYPWGRENLELLEFHHYICAMQKKHQALRHGSLIPIMWERDLLAYARCEGEDRLIVLLHTGSEERSCKLPAWLAGFSEEDRIQRIIYTDEEGYNVGRLAMRMKDKVLEIKMGKNSAMILSAEFAK